jgi:predicted membrane-bound spermidine synthase
MTFSLSKMSAPPKLLFYIIFAVSGFSGLIYESIWSHYLKLYLGHAAYAQTLVLIIFMGGMAIGAWLCSRLSRNWYNVLLGYAFVEAIIGLLALSFHGVFTQMLAMVFDSVIPALGSPFQITSFKWLSASLLILPQSILLGMTFPLMVSGVLRRHPANSGRTVSTLYFANSIGAVAGVLVSGFFLIREAGLPGTIVIAGWINILLAIIVGTLALVSRETPESFPATAPSSETEAAKTESINWFFILPGIAFITGAASFIYEIVWIRMLSLVLSSSTHSFELMLSAFILGLAGGGFWIRKRIDNLVNPIKTLALIQIAMGLLALATLPVYGQTFEWMQSVITMLTKTQMSYSLFNIISHLMALAVMLPAAFCAGMTLPLITAILIRRGRGEQSIGTVYATNTLGAIVGIIFAVHVGFPGLGLKNLLAVGAAMDIIAGIALLYFINRTFSRRNLSISVTSIALYIIFITAFQLDSHKMASGVYRHGQINDANTTEVLWHKDGKTASIDFIRNKNNGVLSLITNGKPDASMLPDKSQLTVDEATMVMAAAVPLSVHPDARIVANIGFGSGLTTHTLLTVPWLERVDTIEIEPAIVEASAGFGERVSRAYNDPRSAIHYEDAKTYFSAHGIRYDIIISEPSNPWVSGVAGLFSDEFYQLITRHLQPDGVFVQWFQLYEIDIHLVSTIFKALDRHFEHYEIYTADNNNLLLVARQHDKIPAPALNVIQQPALFNELKQIGIHTYRDFELRHLSGKTVFEPLMASYPLPYNSDYYPILDQNASRARFMGQSAEALVELGSAVLPLLPMLNDAPPLWSDGPVVENPWLKRSSHVLDARAVLYYLKTGNTNPRYRQLETTLRLNVEYLRDRTRHCTKITESSTFIDALKTTASKVTPFVDAEVFVPVWEGLDWATCKNRYSQEQQQWITLVGAIGARDATAMARLSESLLKNDHSIDNKHLGFLLATAMLGNLNNNHAPASLQLWEEYRDEIKRNDELDLVFRLLVAHSQPEKEDR